MLWKLTLKTANFKVTEVSSCLKQQRSFSSHKNNAEQHWERKLHKQTGPNTQPITRYAWIAFSFKHFSFHHRISGQCSNPCCSSESLLYLSSDETLLSMSGGHWFLCWISCTTTLCNLHPAPHNRGKRERFSLCSRIVQHFNLDFEWSSALNVSRNQCGQTSRPVVGTAI